MKAWPVLACASVALLVGLYEMSRVARPSHSASAPPASAAAPETMRAISQAREEAAAVADAAPLPDLPADLPRPGLPAETPALIGGASKAPPPLAGAP